jgi:hypothetical protein
MSVMSDFHWEDPNTDEIDLSPEELAELDRRKASGEDRPLVHDGRSARNREAAIRRMERTATAKLIRPYPCESVSIRGPIQKLN